MAHKGYAANKKRTLQTKKMRCKQKTDAANKKREPLQTKKDTAANKKAKTAKKKKEELLNAGVHCNKKRAHIMRGMALHPS